ncbi:MAG: exodeoxyribonuclease VII large subunit [Phycisphaerales bacterium]
MKASKGPLSGPTLPGLGAPPERAAPPPDDRVEDDGERPLSVSQLASVIERALRVGVPSPILVVGEVSGFRDRTHWWFDLKDEGAVVSCAMFRSAAAKAGFEPTNGQEVVVRGRVAFYDKQGKTQIYVDSIKPVGMGELDARFRALCEELRGLGWFDEARKRPLPWFPRKIAVVTSRTGAALQDVLNTMNRRCPAVVPVVIDVRVQGDRAAPEVAAAIDWVSREYDAMGVDAIIVTRGGGSMEDLWAFNERVVAEAIVRCAIPVVAAIGHESDTTIAELVADERCSTPTQAAMRLTPDRASLTEQLAQYDRRLTNGLRTSLRHEVGRVRAIISHPLFANPRGLVERAKDRVHRDERDLTRGLRARVASAHLRLERLAVRVHAGRPEAVHAARTATVREVDARLRGAMRRTLERRGDRLGAYERELRAVGPMQVLARGYSVTLDAQGRAIRDPAQVSAGQAIESRVLEGVIRSTVVGGDAKPLRKRRAADADPNAEQMDLF